MNWFKFAIAFNPEKEQEPNQETSQQETIEEYEQEVNMSGFDELIEYLNANKDKIRQKIFNQYERVLESLGNQKHPDFFMTLSYVVSDEIKRELNLMPTQYEALKLIYKYVMELTKETIPGLGFGFDRV
jgi:hypothetical protein